MSESDEEHMVRCWINRINGWRFQGFEDAKIALIEGIVTGLVEKRSALNKAAVSARKKGGPRAALQIT
ncbi:hypothetical protein [Pseudothauera rhizosphaerae]|uniref:Uncharacterized protein n=1 Tax=Pseudothauera rhizosphaerae TaxID=2565932 RepID=A0A4S4ADW2_9RHOO|nr:hypothetical protein [Pseudothauera rhizosphaerae]THF57200.1 hypothetical protein E6O51_18020 [Pseudothauera rhizosphaerae]